MQNPTYLHMHTELCNLDLKPNVSAFALFSTDFVSVAAAMQWVFDEEEGAEAGQEKMRHPFISSLPETEATKSTQVQYLDLEKGGNIKVCYLCNQPESKHNAT